MVVTTDKRFPLGRRGDRPLSVPAERVMQDLLKDLIPGAAYRNGALRFSWDATPAVKRALGAADFHFPDIQSLDLPGLEEYQRHFAKKLRGYQKQMVQFLALRAYAINADPMRCLSGKSRLTVNRGGKAFTITMERLAKGVSGQLGWDLSIPTKAQSMDAHGSIVLNDITLLHRPGKKPCMRVKLSNGSTLECTAEHKLLTPRGKVPLQDLRVGDFVLVAEWPKAKKDWKRPENKSRYLQGFWDHPFAEKGTSKRKNRPVERYARVKKHRLAAEASASGLPFDEYVRHVREGLHDGLVFLDPRIWHVHHKDGDHSNNDPINLEVMTQEQHSRLHGIEGAWRHVNGRAVPATIVSMEYAGEQEVFDLTMANPLNNYVAEGVVVSNSGKTPTTLAAASVVGSKKTLIVCPSIAKLVWASELVKWMKQPSLILYGRSASEAREFCVPCDGTGVMTLDGSPAHCPSCKAKNGQSYGARIHKGPEASLEALSRARFVIANYDILTPQMKKDDAGKLSEREDLPGWYKALAMAGFDLGILDEAHILRGRPKGSGEARTRTRKAKLQVILQNVERVWALSGTPIFGRVADLWSLLDVISEGLYGRPGFSFDKRYAGGHSGEWGWQNDGMTNPEELTERLAFFMLKRSRSEILPELPPKTRQIIRIDASKASFKMPEERTSSALHNALRVTAKIKEETVVESVVGECGEGAKVVVFAYARDHAESLGKAIAEASVTDPRLKLRNMRVWCVTGDTPPEARFKQAQAYREWVGSAAFVATIDSVPVAISLKGAQSVHFAALNFDPASLLQAEDRPYEVGTSGLAIIYYVVDKTVDDHVVSIVLPKMEAMEAIVKEDAAGDFRTAFGAKEDPVKVAEEIWSRMSAAAL